MWGNTIPVATKVLRTFRLYSKKIVSKIFALNKTTRPLLDLTAGLFVFQQSNVERDFMHIAEMAFNSGFPPYKFFVFNMKIFPKLSLWNFFIICHWVSVRSIVLTATVMWSSKKQTTWRPIKISLALTIWTPSSRSLALDCHTHCVAWIFAMP